MIRFQPLVDLDNNTVIGYEALSSRLSTGDYPSAVQTLKSIASIGTNANNSLFFINMTIEDVINPNFCHAFLKTANEMGIDCSNIALEVSEETPYTILETAKKNLSVLRKHNIKIALDDFCSKNTGLQHILDLPLDIIKVDQSVIQRAPAEKKARSIMKFLVQMANDIGCSVVAEGIETKNQFECAKDTGIDIGQGFAFYIKLSEIEQKIFINTNELYKNLASTAISRHANIVISSR